MELIDYLKNNPEWTIENSTIKYEKMEKYQSILNSIIKIEKELK